MSMQPRGTKLDPTTAALQAKMVNGISITIFLALLIAGSLGAIGLNALGLPDWTGGLVALGFTLVGLYILFSLKVANQWEKAVVLRLGRFIGLKGPGAFWIVPIVDTIPAWIDHRVMVTPFAAEKTLTKEATAPRQFRTIR